MVEGKGRIYVVCMWWRCIGHVWYVKCVCDMNNVYGVVERLWYVMTSGGCLESVQD